MHSQVSLPVLWQTTPGQAQRPSFNFSTSPKNRNDFNQFNIRLDHVLRSRDQIFGSYSFDDRPHAQPAVMPLQGLRFPFRSQILTVTETHAFSPTVVNEARFGYNRSKTFLVSEGALGKNFAADVFGFKNTSQNPFDFGVPRALITGFQTVGSFPESIGALDEDYQFVDNLSVARGRHNLKAGVNFIREKFFQITDFSGVPSATFDGRFTGAGLGDFLLGVPFMAGTSIGDSSQNLRTNWWAGYLQNDWRIRPNLTVNLGLRYEHAKTPFDLDNRTQWFDPAVRQVVTSKSGGVRNGIVDPDWNDFGPRVGFAYSPLRNTVVRAAYGIFYSTDNWNELQFLVIGPDFFSSQTLNSDPVRPTISLGNLFPPGVLGGGTLTPFSIDKRNRTPYVQQWNFNVQHTFGKDLLVDLGYIGNTGQKLPQRRNQNIAREDPTGTILVQPRSPFPDLGFILLTYNGGWSSYNALTTRVEKRMAAGLYLLGSYTWSHSIDLGHTDEFSASSCCFKVLDRGNSTFDVRQRLVISYLYELPLGRNRRFLSGASGWVDRLAGGWKINGISTFSSGQFKTPSLPFNWPNLGSFSQSRPDRVGNPFPARQTFDNWLNPNAFVPPGCPTFKSSTNPNPTGPRVLCEDGSPGRYVQGNAARNSLEMPGINNWDFVVMKDTRVSERLLTQFRAEFFNGFNHTQFGDASTSLTPGVFGRINGLRISPREIQFGLKLIF